MYLILIYIIGFVLSLTFFKFYGKAIGFDYDDVDDTYDDWQSNTDAWMAFSMAWPLVIPMLIVIGILILLRCFSKWFIKL